MKLSEIKLFGMKPRNWRFHYVAWDSFCFWLSAFCSWWYCFRVLLTDYDWLIFPRLLHGWAPVMEWSLRMYVGRHSSSLPCDGPKTIPSIKYTWPDIWRYVCKTRFAWLQQTYYMLHITNMLRCSLIVQWYYIITLCYPLP